MHTNALIHEKSPYLRQHAHNPVNWLPWGEAAFAKSRSENKPIFLSIGYSTCHWCHVMAHESFENEEIAEVLNRGFIPIKIDREERPDVDRVYMLFVQASTGSGGWPMSVWLTPDLKPFYGGTYFPPDSRYGRPGFLDLLRHLSKAWDDERERIESSGDKVLDQLRAYTGTAKISLDADRSLFDLPFPQFRRSFDSQRGGFGSAPKFPRPVVLNYLLRYYALEGDGSAVDMVTVTLREMARGGMHDQLGGGFHRYSVDERWFVPHFEKMLYDQAQLAISYLEAFEITHDTSFGNVARDIFEYVLRDLADPAGGFYSAEDADSPDPENPSHSGEGSFYIWREREIEALLGPEDSAIFCARYGVELDGNVDQDPHGEFTGRNILYEAQNSEEPGALAHSRQVLFYARSHRPRPHLDNKILTSWNSLMISALAKGSVVLDEPRYLAAAERAAAFLSSAMYNPQSGQLLRRFCDGEAAVPAFLDDYAFFAQALLDLFEATFDPARLQMAVELVRRNFKSFEDETEGGFFSTTAHAPDIVLRIKDDYDGAEPSGNSVATDVLLRLAHLTGDDGFKASADRSLRSFAPKVKSQSTIAPQMVVALGRALAEPRQYVVRCAQIDSALESTLKARRQTFRPWSVMLAITDHTAQALRETAPFLASLERKGRLTIYECRNFTCELPEVID